MQIEDSTTKIREDPRSNNLWGPHSGVLNPAAPIYNSLCEIVYDSGEVNFLCCSVHFFKFKKFEFEFFCELVVSVSLFNYLSSNSLVKSPSSQNHKKKLASSSLFLSSLSLRLIAVSIHIVLRSSITHRYILGKRHEVLCEISGYSFKAASTRE